LTKVNNENLAGESLYQFRQTVLLLLIGELYGLNTFKKILSSVGITSRNCYKVWSKFSYKQLYGYVSHYLVLQFKESMEELCSKSDSTWSRASITLIIDETIFKTWLQSKDDDELFSTYFGKYFSGQTHKSEYGFRYSLSGVSIGEKFYPLYFSPIKKGEKCTVEAQQTVKKMEALIRQCAKKQGFKVPNISLSVDGGYNSEDLIKECSQLKTKTNFICVPKKNNVVKIGHFQGSLTKYIEECFLPEEENSNCQQDFFIRKKGYYNCKKMEVVFLFFRLNGSKKVSIIYSTNLSIKAKTLRRRWFNRTKIELFFRKIKDTLKVQQSTADSCEAFFKKVSLFILKVVFTVRFEKYCRKQFKEFKDLTFWQLRQKIIYMNCELSIIFDQFEKCRFCNTNTVQKAKYQYFRNIRYSPI